MVLGFHIRQGGIDDLGEFIGQMELDVQKHKYSKVC
ncbi:hypothetical protein HNQ88_004212 [Aureibacter tunicatorum]|uniref:Uncharacterized protein n=1 Tax=Aureibacter tunicatorum TaxID=866807 RepID=A0AAE4BTW1_9BACT|nr:hypothetical protein [Aureibacter tunicatorum]